MHLITGGALDGVHLLDGRGLEGLRIHGEARVDHLSGIGALDQDPIHSSLMQRKRLPAERAKRVPQPCFMA